MTEGPKHPSPKAQHEVDDTSAYKNLPILFQRIESAIAAVALIYFSWRFNLPWGLFVLILVIIDVSLIGYLINNKVGALIYNIGHAYVLPALILVLSQMLGNKVLLTVSLAWLAHISIDRALGFGLKYSSGFKNTHLQR